jgi:hypothetical protein
MASRAISVNAVSNVLQPSCFLAEWYQPDVTSRTVEDIATVLNTAAAKLRAEGTQVRLLMALAVPADEVLYVMFSAYAADSVIHTCERANIPLERLSSDVLLGSMWLPEGRADTAATL